MIQFLLFSKTNGDLSNPKLIDWDPMTVKQIPGEITSHGTLCLTNSLYFDAVSHYFKKAGYCDCLEKPEKINLKRALRFDEKRERNRPKQLLFNSNSTGAFKRGITTFFEKHYTASDPPCLILTSATIFGNLVREGILPAKKPVLEIDPDGEEPSLFQLMNIPFNSPLIKKLENVYIGESIEVQHTRALIYQACHSDSPVLIQGETGTGKDVIAMQIFENSTRYNTKFYRVNCSALPDALLESELFGHIKGSFTGATSDKIGLFTVAKNGTIFLDEIGDLSLANQVKILHAVENKEIRQVGSNKSVPVNVRIISATNRNLDAMMKQGTFREDLFFRISSFRIKAYPLREHPEDIPILAKAYWEKRNRTSDLSTKFCDYLKSYYWPGNVRELYATLNTVVDYYNDISPRPEHIDAIRKYRQEVLIQSKANEKDDPEQLLKIRCHQVLTSVQNILRAIKVELRPIIYDSSEAKNKKPIPEGLKKFLSRQISLLNDLCLEPSYFRRWETFKMVTKYRYILDRTVTHWPLSAGKLYTLWNDELKNLDEEINQAVMEVLWGRIDQ